MRKAAHYFKYAILLVSIISINLFSYESELIEDNLSAYQLDSETPPEKIIQLLEGDILGFFNLSDQYDTPLKIKTYLESDEGKRSREAIQTLREESRNMEFKFYFAAHEVENYDLKDKSFKILINENIGGELLYSTPMNVKDDVHIWVPDVCLFHDKEKRKSYLKFVVINESEALEIENCLNQGYRFHIKYKVGSVKRYKIKSSILKMAEKLSGENLPDEKALSIKDIQIFIKTENKELLYTPMCRSLKKK